ncbi:MAG: hypothetical protein AB1757_30330 [Acidobacteriota bacterium]
MLGTVMKKETLKETAIEETTEKKDGFFAKAVNVGIQAANLGHEATRLKANVSHAVTDALEDSKREARRALKRGVNAAEDLVDETAYRVKHHPIRSIAIAFGAGTILGVIVTSIGKKILKA